LSVRPNTRAAMTIDRKSPLALKAVLGYLLVIGVLQLAWPFLGFGTDHPDFEARSASSKAGAYFMQALIAAGYVAAAIGLLQRRFWAPSLTYLVLALSALSSAKGFSWGFAGGRPTREIYLSSLVLFLAWHAVLGSVVFRNR